MTGHASKYRKTSSFDLMHSFVKTNTTAIMYTREASNYTSVPTYGHKAHSHISHSLYSCFVLIRTHLDPKVGRVCPLFKVGCHVTLSLYVRYIRQTNVFVNENGLPSHLAVKMGDLQQVHTTYIQSLIISPFS